MFPAALIDSTPRLVIFLLRTEDSSSASFEGRDRALLSKSCFFLMGLPFGDGREAWQPCWIAFVTVLSFPLAGQMEGRRPSFDGWGADFDWNFDPSFFLLCVEIGLNALASTGAQIFLHLDEGGFAGRFEGERGDGGGFEGGSEMRLALSFFADLIAFRKE